jgi:predicted DNA-binding transcriptional regulator AlpA
MAATLDYLGNYLTLGVVLERVGNPHRSTVWRWVKRGLFPLPRRRLGQRRMMWTEREIEGWLEDMSCMSASPSTRMMQDMVDQARIDQALREQR